MIYNYELYIIYVHFSNNDISILGRINNRHSIFLALSIRGSNPTLAYQIALKHCDPSSGHKQQAVRQVSILITNLLKLRVNIFVTIKYIF